MCCCRDQANEPELPDALLWLVGLQVGLAVGHYLIARWWPVVCGSCGGRNEADTAHCWRCGLALVR